SYDVSNAYAPCLLFSIFNTFVPIHFSKSSGSSYALKSNSKGKSNSLVITISCLPSSAFTFVFCSILFGFIVLHYYFQFIKPVVPHLPKWFNKISNFFHFFHIEVVVNFSSALFRFKQLTLSEYLQM